MKNKLSVIFLLVIVLLTLINTVTIASNVNDQDDATSDVVSQREPLVEQSKVMRNVDIEQKTTSQDNMHIWQKIKSFIGIKSAKNTDEEAKTSSGKVENEQEQTQEPQDILGQNQKKLNDILKNSTDTKKSVQQEESTGLNNDLNDLVDNDGHDASNAKEIKEIKEIRETTEKNFNGMNGSAEELLIPHHYLKEDQDDHDKIRLPEGFDEDINIVVQEIHSKISDNVAEVHDEQTQANIKNDLIDIEGINEQGITEQGMVVHGGQLPVKRQVKQQESGQESRLEQPWAIEEVQVTKTQQILPALPPSTPEQPLHLDTNGNLMDKQSSVLPIPDYATLMPKAVQETQDTDDKVNKDTTTSVSAQSMSSDDIIGRESNNISNNINSGNNSGNKGGDKVSRKRDDHQALTEMASAEHKLVEKQPHSAMPAYHDDSIQEKFASNEAQVLILPNDDVVLGALSEEARLSLMDLNTYIDIFWDRYRHLAREPQRLQTQHFIEQYHK